MCCWLSGDESFMALELETHYEKEGKQYALKTPRINLMGKNMDDGEEHTFYALADPEEKPPRSQYNKSPYPKYDLYAKYDGEDGAFNLDLSKQAFDEIVNAQVTKGDVFTAKKAWYTDEESGSKRPIIEVVRNGQRTLSEAPAQQQQEGKPIDAFVQEYLEKCPEEMKSKEHCILTYFMETNGVVVDSIGRLYEQYNQ